MYKLRIYKKNGIDKGNLDREEMFFTKEDAIKRCDELFVYKDYALNPTLWERDSNGGWTRIHGY